MAYSDDFNDFLTVLNPKVLRNSRVVTPASLGQDFLLHIDTDKVPAAFTPMMPRSAGASEDNTVPRVTVAPSLAGCILAYCRLVYDVQERSPKGFVNGYTVSGFHFDYALQPNNKLVFDAEDTDEHWLVPYNKATLRYVPFTMGKMFVHSLTIIPNDKQLYNTVIVQIFLEITSSKPLRLDRERELTHGHYAISADISRMNDNKDRLTLGDAGTFQAVKITAGEYAKHKLISAVSLEHCVDQPLYFKW